jgi:hypothetical protein
MKKNVQMLGGFGNYMYLCGIKINDYAERIILLSGRRVVQCAGLRTEKNAGR